MENYNKQEFSNYTVLDSQQAGATGVVAKKYMASVFMWMFAALGVSTVFAFMFAQIPSLMETLYIQTDKGLRLSGMGWVVTFAPLGFVLLMNFGFAKLSSAALTGVFLLYAAVTGMGLSCILWLYAPGSIIGCFATASAMFGVMAVMGYTTKKDLTGFGQIMMMGLVGIVISVVVNMFLQSSALGYIISLVGVAVFTGLTAYDVQVLKRIGAGVEYEGTSTSDTQKLAIMGALRLYLDFLNLFLMLLRLFGDRRN